MNGGFAADKWPQAADKMDKKFYRPQGIYRAKRFYRQQGIYPAYRPQGFHRSPFSDMCCVLSLASLLSVSALHALLYYTLLT